MKVMMLVGLRKSGVNTHAKQYNKVELIKLCESNNISKNLTIENVVKGWASAPKGLL